MWENLKSEGWPQNKESNEGRRYFEYVLETYPTIFKRYEEVTKDNPERKVDAMKQAFAYIWLHIYDVIMTGIATPNSEWNNIMEIDGGPASPQLSYVLDKALKSMGFNDSLINGEWSDIDQIRLESVQKLMNRNISLLQKTYTSEIDAFDKKIDEIKKHRDNAQTKEKILNVMPAYHILKATKSEDTLKEEHESGTRELDMLINLETYRTQLKSTQHLLNTLEWKDLLTMEPLDVINTLSIYFQFMIETAQLAKDRLIDRDDMYKIDNPNGIIDERTY